MLILFVWPMKLKGGRALLTWTLLVTILIGDWRNPPQLGNWAAQRLGSEKQAATSSAFFPPCWPLLSYWVYSAYQDCIYKVLLTHRAFTAPKTIIWFISSPPLFSRTATPTENINIEHIGLVFCFLLSSPYRLGALQKCETKKKMIGWSRMTELPELKPDDICFRSYLVLRSRL